MIFGSILWAMVDIWPNSDFSWNIELFRQPLLDLFLAIAIAIGIGVGVAIGVLLAQNMIALDAGNLGGFINQTGQQFIHLWHQTLAALSLG